jgi:hypothetical protein
LSAYPLGVAGFIKTIEVVAVEAVPVPALFTADTRNTYVYGTPERPVTVIEVEVEAVCENAVHGPLELPPYSIT